MPRNICLAFTCFWSLFLLTDSVSADWLFILSRLLAIQQPGNTHGIYRHAERRTPNAKRVVSSAELIPLAVSQSADRFESASRADQLSIGRNKHPRVSSRAPQVVQTPDPAHPSRRIPPLSWPKRRDHPSRLSRLAVFRRPVVPP